jgi:hypothetical protein
MSAPNKQERLTMKSYLAAFAIVAALASPALADCAGDLTKIEETMKTVKLDEASMAKLTSAVEAAKAANAAKDEASCDVATKEAMILLGM